MQTASIIEHRGYDSFEAATKVVCAFLLYDERLGVFTETRYAYLGV